MSGSPGASPGWSGSSRVATFGIGAGLAVLASLSSSPGVLQGALVNPDTAMRLLRLKASLAAGAPLHAVMRDSSGHGTVLHWSHLLDALILAVAAPVAAVGGWDAGLRWATVVFGPVTVGLLALAVAWAIGPLARAGPGRLGPVWMAGLVLGLTNAIVSYGLSGVIHHHVLIAATAAMAVGYAIRSVALGDGRAGAYLGLWIAFGLWLSPEALAFGLMAYGGIWVSWLMQPTAAVGRAIAAAGFALFGVTVLAWVTDPPAAGYLAVEPDRISVMFVWLTAGAAFAGSFTLLTLWARPIALAAGIGTAVAWFVAYPQILRGTSGLMSPEQAAAFFGGILEMSPVNSPAAAILHLGSGSIAIIFLAWAAWRRRSAVILYIMLCALVLVALGARHLRFAAYPATLAAGLLPIAIAMVMRSGLPDRIVARVRIAMIAAVLALPALGGYGLAALASGDRDLAEHNNASCALGGATELVNPLGDAIVLTPVNDGPFLLWRTHIRTVGTLYHRGIEGYMRSDRAWFDPADPHDAVLAAGATYVLLCPQSGLAAPAGSLLARLVANDLPPWLERDGASGGYVLYRVVRP